MHMSQKTPTFDTPAHQTPIHRPPGPARRWWGLSWLHALRLDYLGFVQSLQRAHGDISYMQILWEHAYDLHSPDMVRAALVDNAAGVIRWERGIEVLSQSVGQSLLTTEGAVWQRQRRMLQPGFAPRRVAGYTRLMASAASQALDAAMPAHVDQALVNVDALMTGLTMDVIMRTLFSQAAAKDTQDAARAVQILSRTGLREMFNPVTLPDWLPLPGKADKRWALRTLRDLIHQQIALRQQLLATAPDSAPQDDLLAMLLNARDDNPSEANGNPSVGLSAAELQDQCNVMFQAGHETSATALLWWCRLMAEHPEAANKASDEVQRVLAGRSPTPEDLPQLEWLSATLKESMRLYPPVPALMSRRTQQAVQLGQWQVPKGSLLRITPWVLHHDARWFPSPEAFQPERFCEGAASIPRGAYMPFGTGPRVCVGQHFATMEMTLIAVMLLQRYALKLPEGNSTMPRGVMGVTLRPDAAVNLIFVRRNQVAAVSI